MLFDLVHPDNEIIVSKEIIPKIKEIIPTSFGNIKSFADILKGYPSVVLIIILVIENNVIKNKLAAVVAKIIILFINPPLASEIRKLATTEIENPANNELITIICSAILCKYPNEISIILFIFVMSFLLPIK